MADEGPRLGCSAGELEVGTEFSVDEGRTWWVVRSEPAYLAPGDPDNLALRFMAAPWDSTGLSGWEEFKLDDNQRVLLERTWGSKKET